MPSNKFIYSLALIAGSAFIFSCAVSRVEAPPPQPKAEAAAPEPAPEPAPKPMSSRDIFQSKCSRCHEASRSYASLTNREVWNRTVSDMIGKDPHWINANQAEVLKGYFDRHNELVLEIFNKSCAGCHQWSKLRQIQKTPAQWKTTITYMGARSTKPLSKDETEILYFGLSGK